MSKQIFIDQANNIKLIATDIDGVWTDARMHYTENGEYMKSFSTYDGMATGLIKERNIEIAILTSENSKIVTARAKKLGIKYVYINEKEKLLRIKYLCNRLNINLNQVAYIGDDINDLEVLKEVGISAMPCSSPILDKFNPDYITKRRGGDGSFREFADLILEYRK
ncbi:MAG: acylneuraminate cytidylyltransferase [Candidatus Marinimicrobia bacterium]|nr:acylneuraminate cytidylyltransferase [Candidatus Neomarinimicrobiota bacterium]|tara:strand:+ start:1313 stop:1810 length:498 start_codon:yes stop_codon:yes gene_type:complete